MPLVVFGYGNVSRGDDAFGPLLLERIEAAAPPGVTLVEDYQLQIDHALDLNGADLALFIDAGTGTPPPFRFYETAPQVSTALTSHALAPEAVLDIFRKVTGAAPPPAFVLCVRGEDFALGHGLSPEGAHNLEAAWQFLLGLIIRPEVELWRGLAARPLSENG